MAEYFTPQERQTLYRVIEARRDIRQFTSDPVPLDVLKRILAAAHHAPSVGFMQPWNFILITSLTMRRRVRELFERTNAQELAKLAYDQRQKLYRTLKLEGILEAPLNIAVTCDRQRDQPFVLGHAPTPETDLYSTCLAIQNMWLAARAEGVGVGWVSILDYQDVARLLDLPPSVQLVAYLCMGYPVTFSTRPLLEEVGWKARTPLESLVYTNTWGEPARSFFEEEVGVS